MGSETKKDAPSANNSPFKVLSSLTILCCLSYCACDESRPPKTPRFPCHSYCIVQQCLLIHARFLTPGLIHTNKQTQFSKPSEARTRVPAPPPAKCRPRILSPCLLLPRVVPPLHVRRLSCKPTPDIRSVASHTCPPFLHPALPTL